MRKRGTGYGSFIYSLGIGLGSNDTSTVIITVNDDGSISLFTGAADLGQGSDEIMALVAAEELGARPEDIVVTSADSGITPFSGLTAGSRQTIVTGRASLEAAKDVKESLLAAAAEMLSSSPGEITFKESKVYLRGELTALSFSDVAKFCYDHAKKFTGIGTANFTMNAIDMKTGQGDVFYDFVYGTHVAEVEVDTDTGKVHVLRIIAVHDVGKAIHAASLEGQIEGGVCMGIGYALIEEVIVKDGRVLTPSFAEYLIPTTEDIPIIETVLIENPSEYGPFGARGASEAPTVPVAPAICNAIYDAVGIRPTELPITAERMRALLKTKDF